MPDAPAPTARRQSGWGRGGLQRCRGISISDRVGTWQGRLTVWPAVRFAARQNARGQINSCSPMGGDEAVTNDAGKAARRAL